MAMIRLAWSLQILDLALTLDGLNAGLAECNPASAYFGLAGLLLFKLGGLVALPVVAWVVGRLDEMWRDVFLVLWCTLGGYVCLSNYYWLAYGSAVVSPF